MNPNIVKSCKVVFKSYDQAQQIMLPLSVSELIPEGHLCRIIDKVVGGISVSALEAYYAGGGASAYHPHMMLKVWIYGYCSGIYTSRPLAKALREQLTFIWLAGGQHPGFKTLSSFRSDRMSGMVDDVFKAVLLFLVTEGYVDLEDLYVDGSKWEANANRHKIVWSKNTARYKAQVLARIEVLLEKVKALQAAEDQQYGGKDLAEVGEGKRIEVVMDSWEVHQRLVGLNELIEAKAGEKKEQRALRQIGRKLQQEQQKLLKYEQQEQLLAGRSSYARTDPDATALWMKDDRLLPGYNVQNTTNHQYITNYTIAQCASDSATFVGHLDKLEQRQADLPQPDSQNVATDAGYGSEENYRQLEERGMIAYLKYATFHREQNGELAKDPFRRENFPYDQEQDCFSCPQGRNLPFLEQRTHTTKTGYPRTIRLYQCENCDDCPLASPCKKSPDKPRIVSFSPKGETYKKQASQRLLSEKGQQMRKARGTEVEGSFGQLKYNMKHRRFILRGIDKVYIEYGLLAIGHNLRKVYCEKSGCWKEYYAQRAAKKAKKAA